ncbi:MAG TPA: diaminopimelate epimerase [Woeseiaceae bacterium]|jgi:diaminopimelate epimerase|nr:diaminopimelate epimerase [Woeseiaceae bacterium]
MPSRNGGRKFWSDLYGGGRPFLKMHGLGNHFVIVDGREAPFEPAAEQVVRICDSALGVGADQLVAVQPAPDGDTAAALRFWNRDGTEAEACGNATRCVAWLLLEETSADEIVLATPSGRLCCRRAGPERVSVHMGRIGTDWREIPLAEARDTCHLDLEAGPLRDPAALSVGNPHLVFFVDDVGSIDLAGLAPSIQANPLFPRQVNVGVAELRSENRLRLGVYERGAGLTMACGSGACAAAFAALWRGLTDARTLAVELPGGELEIGILADGSAVMTGPVAFSFSGRLPT